MLLELDIRDLAVAEHVRVSFGPGLNVITGETGAGKSVIIDALEVLLGGRADGGIVRHGAKSARLEGVFRFEVTGAASELDQALIEAGAEPDDGTVVITRDVPATGRGVARINNRATVLGVLSAIGSLLVDIHGQSDHTAVLQAGRHLRYLDRFAGIEGARAEFAEHAARLRVLRAEIDRLRMGSRERARMQDRLAFEVKEIGDAELRAEEEEELIAERLLLENAVRLAALVDAAHAALLGAGRQAGAADALGLAADALRELAELDPRRQEDALAAAGLQEQAADLARALRAYRDGIENDPERLSRIEERLALLSQLRRKYGATLTEVMAYGERASAELESLLGSEETAEQLEQEESALVVALGKRAEALSASRTRSAFELVSRVETQLRDLGLPHARLGVHLTRRFDESGVAADVAAEQVVESNGDECASGTGRYWFDLTGIDRAELVITLNPDEPLRPLARVASGGETSRVLLALKAVLGAADNVPILVFDEIEAGLGGRTGGVVGRKLAQLAEHHQVICITHLPQIAACATHHIRVVKSVRDGRSHVQAEVLDDEERVEELAAMMGGKSAPNLTSAREMLGVSPKTRRALRAI